MQILRALFITLLILVAPAARADSIFKFNDDLFGKQGLTIEVSGSMARLTPSDNDQRIGIYRDGTLYMLLKQADGSYVAARAEDLIAAIDGARGTRLKAFTDKSIAATLKGKPFTFRKLGSDKLFGFAGTAWDIIGLDGANPKFPYRVVASKSPQLKTMAEAYRRFIEVSLATSFELIGEKATQEMLTEVRAKSSLGYPLFLGGQSKMISYQSAKIDPKRFDLPGATASLADLTAAYKAQPPFENGFARQ